MSQSSVFKQKISEMISRCFMHRQISLCNQHCRIQWQALFTVILISLTVSACGYESIYSDLDERQANEMLVLLMSENLLVKKKATATGWTLQTKMSELPRAMQVLKSNGYPKDEFQTLGDVFKKEGLVSSPLEEKARLLYGLSQELANTISTIDGVIVSRVHIAIPEKNILSDEQKPSSASVFIKHRVDSKIDTQLSSIKALVVNSVEGLAYDNVTVSLFPSDLSQPMSNSMHSVAPDSRLSRLLKHYENWVMVAVALFLLILLLITIKKRSFSRARQLILKTPGVK